jgi:hypothetical protein
LFNLSTTKVFFEVSKWFCSSCIFDTRCHFLFFQRTLLMSLNPLAAANIKPFLTSHNLLEQNI